MIENNVSLESVTYEGDCECCGYVSYHNVFLKVNDKEFDYCFDSHFGGDWCGDMAIIYMKILAELGYNINFATKLIGKKDSDEDTLEDIFNYYDKSGVSSADNEHEIIIHITYERMYSTHERYCYEINSMVEEEYSYDEVSFVSITFPEGTILNIKQEHLGAATILKEIVVSLVDMKEEYKYSKDDY